MSSPKFKVGDSVLIIGDSYKPHPITTKLIGRITKIKTSSTSKVEGNYIYYVPETSFYFLERDLKSLNIKCRKLNESKTKI
jgi:hypothetical protein